MYIGFGWLQNAPDSDCSDPISTRICLRNRSPCFSLEYVYGERQAVSVHLDVWTMTEEKTCAGLERQVPGGIGGFPNFDKSCVVQKPSLQRSNPNLACCCFFKKKNDLTLKFNLYIIRFPDFKLYKSLVWANICSHANTTIIKL